MTEEGDYGDYSVWVHVYYVDMTKPLAQRLQHDSVEINIIGVTYPQDFDFIIPNNVRKFVYTRDIAADIFGQSYASLATLPDTYVMTYRNQKNEFSINRGSGYTATLKKIEYYLQDIDIPTNSTGGYIDSAELSVGDNTINQLVLDETLGYTKDSTNGGMTTQVISVPVQMKKYRLTARITIGGRSPFTKYITIIVWDDNYPLVNYSVADPLYAALSQKYTTDYSIQGFNGNLYKTELLSLYGTLDLSNSNVTSLLANTNYSVFTYMKYITSITLDGLTQITLNDLATGNNQLDVSNIASLTSISLNGCTGLNGSVLDLTASPYVTSIDLRGTSAGITLVNSRVTSLQLGSPISVSITNPTVLGDSGTTLTIQDSTNLTDITLVNVNTTNVHGFNAFNILTSAVS